MPAGVDEEMQHLEAELLVLAELFLVEGHDVLVADAQAGGVELELGLLLGRDADTDAGGLVDHGVKLVQLGHVVEDGYGVVPAVVDELGYVGDVGVFLVTVADDVEVLVHDFTVIQRLDQVEIECR